MYNGPPPWTCCFCGEHVVSTGRSGGSLHVHHIDEDRSNNDQSNLAACHNSCHGSHHWKPRLPANWSERMRKKWDRDRVLVPNTKCPCGAGPFKGTHGLRIHQARWCGIGGTLNTQRMLTRDEEDLAIRLYVDDRMPLSSVAHTFGASAGTVRNTLLRRGIQPRPRKSPRQM